MGILQIAGRVYLTFWTTLVFLFAWLPLVRCLLDGETYEWGTTHFGVTFRGAGLEGDLWFLAAKLAVGLAAVYGVCRLWRPGLALAMTMAAAYLADSLFLYLTADEPIIFRGDTLGVVIDVGLTSVVLSSLAALASLGLLAGWSGLPAHRAPDLTNRRYLLLLAAMLPVQWVLLRFGEPHGTTDAVGVILTILQWLSLPFALLRIRAG